MCIGGHVRSVPPRSQWTSKLLHSLASCCAGHRNLALSCISVAGSSMSRLSRRGCHWPSRLKHSASELVPDGAGLGYAAPTGAHPRLLVRFITHDRVIVRAKPRARNPETCNRRGNPPELSWLLGWAARAPRRPCDCSSRNLTCRLEWSLGVETVTSGIAARTYQRMWTAAFRAESVLFVSHDRE